MLSILFVVIFTTITAGLADHSDELPSEMYKCLNDMKAVYIDYRQNTEQGRESATDPEEIKFSKFRGYLDAEEWFGGKDEELIRKCEEVKKSLNERQGQKAHELWMEVARGV